MYCHALKVKTNLYQESGSKGFAKNALENSNTENYVAPPAMEAITLGYLATTGAGIFVTLLRAW